MGDQAAGGVVALLVGPLGIAVVVGVGFPAGPDSEDLGVFVEGLGE